MIQLLLALLLGLSPAVLFAQDEAPTEDEAPKPKKKKPVKKKAEKPSKYRFTNPAEQQGTYRFDADGNPVEPKKKKKKSQPKKPVSTDGGDGDGEIDGVVPSDDCGSGESCGGKNG